MIFPLKNPDYNILNLNVYLIFIQKDIIHCGLNQIKIKLYLFVWHNVPI